MSSANNSSSRWMPSFVFGKESISPRLRLITTAVSILPTFLGPTMIYNPNQALTDNYFFKITNEHQMFVRLVGSLLTSFGFGLHYSRYFGNNQLCQHTLKMFSIFTGIEAIVLSIHGTDAVCYI